MPLLAYCVSLPVDIAAAKNIEEAQLKKLEIEGLRCYYSPVDDFRGDQQKTTAIALGFHRVNSALFAAVPILPFRFPTLASSVDDLTSQVENQAVRLRRALEKLGDRVQMEITISIVGESAPRSQSGTEYLRAIQARNRLLEQASEALRAAGRLALKWRQKPQEGRMRLLALVERGFQQAFSQNLADVSLPSGVECRVVGPWPPTEFIEE